MAVRRLPSAAHLKQNKILCAKSAGRQVLLQVIETMNPAPQSGRICCFNNLVLNAISSGYISARWERRGGLLLCIIIELIHGLWIGLY